MKKIAVPSSSEIENAYHQLEGGSVVSIQEWVRFSELSRFDPRMAEAWIKRMSKEWKNISPILLRQESLKGVVPASIGLLLEQVEDYALEKKSKKLFRIWKDGVLYLVPPASGESYLIAVHPFASSRILNDAIFPTRSFQVWGFSGSDIFINKALSQKSIREQTSLSVETRSRKLNHFILEKKKKHQPRFVLEDYLSYCDYLISKRIAQMDLKRCNQIQSHGNTKSRFYTIP